MDELSSTKPNGPCEKHGRRKNADTILWDNLEFESRDQRGLTEKVPRGFLSTHREQQICFRGPLGHVAISRTDQPTRVEKGPILAL